MNRIVWPCRGLRDNTLGCLGANEREANRERLRRYEALVARQPDDPDFAHRWLRGQAVKRRARHAGMSTALAFVTTMGRHLVERRAKPRVSIKVQTAQMLYYLHGIADALKGTQP